MSVGGGGLVAVFAFSDRHLADRGLASQPHVSENAYMVLEVAILNVLPGREEEFERAMREANPLIRATRGFVAMDLRRSIETPNRYLLQVCWRVLEDHTVGFRQSERYDRWRELLHHFYDPFPMVEHYGEPVKSIG